MRTLRTLATVSVLCCGAMLRADAARPDIVLFLADDLGYGDLAGHGNPHVRTPQLDAFVRDGVEFTHFYVSPICSPTRASLLTGRYTARTFREVSFRMDPAEVTVAEMLRAAGYKTGMFGKWHLGYSANNRPTNRGFDWFYGFLPACRSYRLLPGMGKSLLGDGDKHNYMTDALAAEAAAFIEKHKDKPWFVYLPFSAVHASPEGGKKLVAKDAGKYRERFPNIADGQRQIYAGMESALDDGVGVVLAKLRELKLEENTLVIFLSDNGGPTWQNTSVNDPLRGQKGDVLEGGIREPFFIQWKGKLDAGKVDDRPIISLDILPTALAVAGVNGDASLEGVNLLPYLTGQKKDAPQRVLCWRYGKKHAVRIGDWKLTDNGDGAKLYHIVNDIGEKTDLAAKEPGKVKELQAAYEQWNKHNIEPKWGGPGKPAKKAALSPAELQAFRLEDDP